MKSLKLGDRSEFTSSELSLAAKPNLRVSSVSTTHAVSDYERQHLRTSSGDDTIIPLRVGNLKVAKTVEDKLSRLMDSSKIPHIDPTVTAKPNPRSLAVDKYKRQHPRIARQKQSISSRTMEENY